ncbi:MAG TPA: mandelate racemase, partial [Burkholderiaceae bacterium]|nr:mandelate racemase [Burkholderiaceae bacterium]
ARALDVSVAPIDRHKPVIIDESDADETSFVTARARGYRGVSSKTCKGTFRALANALRCRLWNEGASAERYFMTGEDLTAQAGLAVQQDCALVSLLGLTHVERNGHHYVNGFANTPQREQRAFLAAHSSFYEAAGDRVRLAIRGGDLDLSSLFVPGLATRVLPDWHAMQPMAQPQLNRFGQTGRSSYA